MTASPALLRDSLTHLPTRTLLMEHARMALARAARNDRHVCLLMLNLDSFGLVNDSLGREAGDRVLRDAAGRLQSAVPDVLVLARSGGDEFCALVADLDPPEVEQVIEAVAGNMRAALLEPFSLDGRTFELGATTGVSHYPHDAQDVDDLFKHAEAAVRQGKELERGSLIFYAGGTSDALERLLLTARLRGALERDEFALDFQPIFGLPHGRPQAVEALLRGHDPERGLIEPMRFIPSAEHSGLIGPIGDWVIERACAQAREWEDLGIDVTVCVNVSMRQFRDAAFVGFLREQLKEHRLAPARITIEVTESTVMRDPGCVEPVLHELQQLGVPVAIDDFGVGYSSLGRLRDMVVDVLKIDGTFLPRDPGDARAARLLGASLELVEALGMAAVVEGVETEAQFRFLCARGGRFMAQGFHLARPLSPEKATALLSEP